MADVVALARAELAAEAEAFMSPPIDLPALHEALDAARDAVEAVIDGQDATLLLLKAAGSAAEAFPPGTRESYALAIVLGAITEAAGGTS
jgi:hypothetical protein